MSDAPALTPRKLIQILERNGFVLDRVRGSHHVYYNPTTKRRTVVPLHAKDLPRGTMFEILKQAGIDRSEIV
jgi:predicted RNA binding protein YcfA (HicA-like mRNA interferase family)